MSYIVDDHSFRAFLNKLTWDDLMEHAKNNFGHEYQIEILMKYEGYYSDYLLNLNDVETDEEPQKIRSFVEAELKKADEDTLTNLMVNMLSEDDLIDELMVTDEECREEIRMNQDIWDGIATLE